MAHLLQSILTQVGLALVPLRAIKKPEQAVAFFRQLGYEISPAAFGTSLQSLSTEADQLLNSIAQLTEANNEETITSAVLNLFARVKGMVEIVRQLQDQISAAGGTLPPHLDELPRRVVDFLLLDFLARQKPDMHATLHLLGLIEHEPHPTPEQPSRLINWNRFGHTVNEPSRIADEVYRWNTDFDTEKFLTRLEHTMRASSLPGGIYPQPAASQAALGNTTHQLPELRFPLFQKGLTSETYSQFGITFSPAEAQGTRRKGLALLPYLMGSTTFDFAVCDRGELIFESTADIRGIGVTVRPPFTAEGLMNLTTDFHASIKIHEKPSRAEEMIVLGTKGGTRLSIEGLGVKWFVEGAPKELDLGFEAEIGTLRLVIASGEGDGFLQSILSGLKGQAAATVSFGMTLLSGFKFKGGSKFAIELGTHVNLGAVEIDGLSLSLEPASDHVGLMVGVVLRCHLGPVTAVVENVGLRSEVHFRPGNLGPADLDFGFKPPIGVGLSVDAPGVIGGGFLRFDVEKHEYSGVLQLEIAEKVSVSAIGLLSTRLPDGGKGYSLVLLIFVERFTPIQLGFGFALTGIGGLFALNRTVNEEVLRAGLKNHTLDSVMFPQDPIRNAPQIISNLNRVFPPAAGHHLFGPMVQLSWGTPTLITAEIGVVLELGARLRLLVLAQIAAILPRREHELVRLQMDAVGVLDFDQGTAALDASLYDSRLLKKFVLTGDMALRLKWEGTPHFALAVGGLHPAFQPPPNFPKLERIAINLASGDNPRIRCEAYFALTANTVQFGARAELYAAASGFSIQGEIGYDVLIQFDPFFFIAEFHAQLQLKRGSTNLFKVKVEGSLAGPRPLHLKGKATFEILWWDVTVRVDTTLVKGEKPPAPAPIDVLPRLKEALRHPENWTTRIPVGQRALVTLNVRPGTADSLLHPLGTLQVKENVVPLNVDISRFGQVAPAGERRFAITGVTVGEEQQTPKAVRDFFAPAQFLELTDAEKLSRPSFEPMDAGVTVLSDAIVFTGDATDWLEVEAIEFETWILDKGTNVAESEDDADEQGHVKFYRVSPLLLSRQARFGAAGSSELRRTGRAKYYTGPAKHQVIREGWTLVDQEQLAEQPVTGVTDRAPTYSEAVAELHVLRRKAPTQSSRFRIVRPSELQTV